MLFRSHILLVYKFVLVLLKFIFASIQVRCFLVIFNIQNNFFIRFNYQVGILEFSRTVNLKIFFPIVLLHFTNKDLNNLNSFENKQMDELNFF